MVELKTPGMDGFVTKEELGGCLTSLKKAYAQLQDKSGKGGEFTGWVTLPDTYDKSEAQKIKEAAQKIRALGPVLVVIGIGGSYIGARAAIEFLRGPRYNQLGQGLEVYFVGNDLSASTIGEIQAMIGQRDFCVNVISKSGTTTEPSVAFRFFRRMLQEKYGDRAGDRIFCTTDRSRGTLKELADREGYETFAVPDDIGGRYSVLSAVGLLPIAAAGADMDKLLGGAAAARAALSAQDMNNPAFVYAALRNTLYQKGKEIELFGAYEPRLYSFLEWIKQLFAESEGKEGQGIFPVAVHYTTDLHSIGQFIQQGPRTMFETILWGEDGSGLALPKADAAEDGLSFLDGKTVQQINRSACDGTRCAHIAGGVPNILLTLSGWDEETLGYLIYFFELSCALSGYLRGINPFDQPGVEEYKRHMFQLLGKPGYEKK